MLLILLLAAQIDGFGGIYGDNNFLGLIQVMLRRADTDTSFAIEREDGAG